MGILPERIPGLRWDTDEAFAFSSQKTVWIRDRWIGLAYYILFALALFWVVFGQILWRNEQFLYKDVQGVARIWYSHPTKKGCSHHTKDCASVFHPAEKLDYCTENAAASAIKKHQCLLADKRTLSPVGDIDNKVFLPTSVRWVTEKQDCQPTPENHYHCAREYKEVDDGEDLFYTDIESFVVQVVSSYDRDTVSGSSLDHQGYFYECGVPSVPEQRGWKERLMAIRGTQGERCGGSATRSNIECLPGEECAAIDAPLPVIGSIATSAADSEKGPSTEIVKGIKKHFEAVGAIYTDEDKEADAGSAIDQHHRTAAEAHGLDLYATSWGDTFTLKKLLELADIDLDRHFNADGRSVRESGTVIEIEAEYNNIYKIASTFSHQPVEYTYRITERTMPYVSREYLAVEQPDDYPRTRRYATQNGILIVFKVSGQFGFFNISFLLLMLATSMALMTSASTVTDIFAIYIHKRRRNYFDLKYEVSPDFSECWKCPKCKFLNSAEHDSCMGHELWTSHIDWKCGEARPATWEAPISARQKTLARGKHGYRASSSMLVSEDMRQELERAVKEDQA